MASAVWSGHLHFGLVAMPVRLLVAARTKTTRFRRLHRKPIDEGPSVAFFPSLSSAREDDDSDLNDAVEEARSTPEPINGGQASLNEYSTVHQVLQAEATAEEIRPEEVVKGYEIAPNEFAAINPRQIKAAEIETSDTIDLFHFVKAETVDPIYFERSYYVAPDPGAEKVYALLLEGMRREECFGIARIGMHRREHTLILRPAEGCLVAHTMFYANEVRPAPAFQSTTEFSNKDLSMAVALIKGYEGEFDPKHFKDLYQERIHKIIEAEVNNRTHTKPTSAGRTEDVPDLMEQIRLSLAQLESKQRDAKKPAKKTPTVTKNKPQRVRA